MGAPHLHAAHLTRVLAAVLARLIDVNDKSAGAGLGPVTKFHAQRAPSISVAAYLERIRRFSNCSDECFVIALIYIDRLIESKNFVLSHLNVHRVVITSVLVAAKFFDDHFYNNAYYARVGGVPCKEMNSLEVEFLMCMNYSLFVTEDMYDKYHRELTNYAHSAVVSQKTLPSLGDVYASEPEPMHQQFQQPQSQQQQQQQQQQHHEQQEPMTYSSPHTQGYFTQNDQQHQRPTPHEVSPELVDGLRYNPRGFTTATGPMPWTYSFPSYGEPMPAYGGDGFGHEVHTHPQFMQMPMHAQSAHDSSYSSGADGPVFMMHAAPPPPYHHHHAYAFGPPQLPYVGMPGPGMYAHPTFYIPVGTR